MNIKEFDYLFDLNGYYILKNVIDLDDIKKANDILKKIEKKKSSELPNNVFFGKKKKTVEKYIFQIF